MKPTFAAFRAARAWRCRLPGCSSLVVRGTTAYRCARAGWWARVGDVVCSSCATREGVRP